MGRPRIESLLSIEDIRRRYEAGESVQSLATACGFSSYNPVLLRLREAGVSIRSRGANPYRKSRSKPDPSRREERICKGQGCDITFSCYKTSNKKYCSRKCRYDDPGLRLLIANSNTKHKISNVSTSGLIGTCSVCGPGIPVRPRSNSASYRCWLNEKAPRWAREYGATADSILSLLAAQDAKCAICSKQLTWSFHIDHDHESGVVRGILCSSCNTGLGLLGDRVDSLEKAVDYLRQAHDGEWAMRFLTKLDGPTVKNLISMLPVEIKEVLLTKARHA
jgi:hypothetical protein